MSLAVMGIEMGKLSAYRRIHVFPATACCAERHRGKLELQAPLHVAKADRRNGLIDLRLLLLECSRRLKNNNEQEEEQTQNIFKIQKVSPLPADELHAATTARMLGETDQIIRSLCLETGKPRLPLNEAGIVITTMPTLQIDFESSMVFDVTAKVPNGIIDLSISYPGHWNNDRRPIDETDTFLTTLFTEYRDTTGTDPADNEVAVWGQ